MDFKAWAFVAAQAISAKWDVYDGFAEYMLVCNSCSLLFQFPLVR